MKFVYVVLFSKVPFDPQLLPPSHMPVVYGPVKSRKAKAEMSQKDTADDKGIGRVCAICNCQLLVCSFFLQEAVLLLSWGRYVHVNNALFIYLSINFLID